MPTSESPISVKELGDLGYRAPNLYTGDDSLLDSCLHQVNSGTMKEVDALRMLCQTGRMGTVTPNRILNMLSSKSAAELDFGRAHCRHNIRTVFDLNDPEDVMRAARIRKVTNSTNGDATMFWTFAPYVFDHLRDRIKISSASAMRNTLNWAADGSLDYTSSAVSLPGLEHLKEVPPFDLAPDPKHVSHRYAAQEAPRLADLLLERSMKGGDKGFEAPEDPSRIATLVNRVIDQRAGVDEVELMTVLGNEFWRHEFNDYYATYKMDRFDAKTERVLGQWKVDEKSRSFLCATVDEVERAQDPRVMKGLVALQAMQDWSERERVAIAEGFIPSTGKELEDATNWSKHYAGKPKGWEPLVDGIYSPTGKTLTNGKRWSGGEGGGRYCNIGEKTNDWNAPYVQVWNNSGFTQLPGWRFKVKDGVRQS